MSGPITPPLEVTEVDGSPDGRPITKIVVSNGDLSISGRTATIDTSGSGGIPGTPAKSVQFNSDPAGTFTGSDRLLFETGSNNAQLFIKSGASATQTEIRAVDGWGIQLGATDTGNSVINQIVLFGENDAPDGILMIADTNVMLDNGALTTKNASTDMVLTTNDGEDKAKITLSAGSDGNVSIQTEGTGGTELTNATTNNPTTLTVKGNGTGDSIVQLSNSTKSISLKCDENNKLKVAGALYNFVFDASSASGGITWPDGTTQTTAASGGGGGNMGEWVGTNDILDFDSNTNRAYSTYFPLFPTSKYSQPTATAVTLSATSSYAYPFYARATGSVSDISIRVTTSGTDQAYYAIYDTGTDGWMDSLLGIAIPSSGSTGVKTDSTFYQTDGTTTTTISLTKGELYWVVYSCLGGATSCPAVASQMDGTYHCSTNPPAFYLNGGGYNPMGAANFRISASQGTTVTTVFPATMTAMGSLSEMSWGNNSGQDLPPIFMIRN